MRIFLPENKNHPRKDGGHEKSSSTQQIAPWYAQEKKRHHKYQSDFSFWGKSTSRSSVGGKKRQTDVCVSFFFRSTVRPLLIPGMTHKSQAAKWRGPLFVDIGARESAKRPRPRRANSTETAHDRVDYLSRSSTRFNTHTAVSALEFGFCTCSECVWEFALVFIFKELPDRRVPPGEKLICALRRARVSEAPRRHSL